jgi:rhamnogalacturonan endolyase
MNTLIPILFVSVLCNCFCSGKVQSSFGDDYIITPKAKAPGLSASQKALTEKGKLIYSSDFSKPLDKKEWIAEIEPKDTSTVYTANGNLVLNTKGGVTVWLNKLLMGNIRIEYDRTVLVEGKPNDRLSDLNQFWMATDPRNNNLFTRSGKLELYDSLSLYYVGMGGNTNSTTRFRKYNGKGERELLQEYTDAAHLLQPNVTYHVSILVKDDETSYWVNGQCYFLYKDAAILKTGYFGFRSTKSRQAISGLKIYQL